MTFTPIHAHRVNAYEAIVEQIEEAISRGDLSPGDRLAGERQLMTDFGVSRPTVREALRVLKANGLVASRPGDPRGPEIISYSPKLLEKSLSRLAMSDGISRAEILQFRLLLAGHAAQLAAKSRTTSDVAAIEQAIERFAETDASDVNRFAAAVNDFHSAVNRASHNQFIESCGEAIGGITNAMMARRLTSDGDARIRMSRSSSDSRALLEDIRSRDDRVAFRRAIDNIYRYYADDLTAEERNALAPLVDAP